MKHGHVTGKKTEKPHASAWYKIHETQHLARIEAEWAARQPLAPLPSSLEYQEALRQAFQRELAQAQAQPSTAPVAR